MKVSRAIGIYEKHSDKHLRDIPIDISVDILIDILNVDKEDDPDVYKLYEINQSQFEKLKTLVPELSNYDFAELAFYYECFDDDYGK